jgi:uncharacterized protein YqfB (UPF0267 family)
MTEEHAQQENMSLLSSKMSLPISTGQNQFYVIDFKVL